MQSRLRFLDHRSEMAARIRDFDWCSHPFGPPQDWAEALRLALDMCLGSSFPMAIYWGPELRLLYNDAWSAIPADRHPWALGRPAREVWQDIWPDVGPDLASAMAGKGVAHFDQLLPMERNGVAQQTWWNYSFSPIRDADGHIRGVFNQGNETTRNVLAERARTAEIDRLREMFALAPMAFALVHGPDFVIEQANDSFRNLVGPREIIGRRAVDALPEVEAQGFIALLHSAFASGEAYRADAARVVLDRLGDGAGEVRYIDFVFQPLSDATGKVTDVLALGNDVTDRALAQEAVRTSEERLQLALDSSLAVGTWDWDVVADRVTADARFARLYGVDPQLARDGGNIAAFFANIHPDDLPVVRAAIDRTLADDTPFGTEYRLIQPDGSVRWVTAQGSVRRDRDGRPVRFPGISFDITERYEAQQLALTTAEDLRALTATQSFVYGLADRLRALDSPEAVMRLSAMVLGRRLQADRVGFYRLVDGDQFLFGPSWHNDRLGALTGSFPVSIMGTRAADDYRAGRTYRADDVARAVAQEGFFAGARARAGAVIGVPLHRQGSWAATLYVNQAEPRVWTPEEIAMTERVAEIAWDAVDRAQAVAGLRESEAKFRAIANSIDQMVWSTRPDGFHDYYNERWYEYTGVPPGSTDGEAWNGMFHPDDQERALVLWNHSLATGEPYRIEYRLRHRSGDYRWVLGSAQPMRGDNGRIVRWFGTCTDIAEIVAAREVLARSRVELEQAVVERTGQLMAAEERLRQAQKMEAVGQLTGGIAHDFNNMLAVVIGAVDLMERRLAQGRTDVTRYLDAARDGATRAAALTQRLLSFARQAPLAPVPVDCNALIAGMIELLSRTLGETILIDTQLGDDLWHAVTDPSQLENAVLNLSVNARDAMPTGGRLTLHTGNTSLAGEQAARIGLAPGDYVCIAVTDTGSGMTDDVAARAFDPFFTTKSVGKGTGLGLSQVFGFVGQLGGHVGLETALGEGTTVRLLIPRYTGDLAPAPVASRDTADARGERHEMILVVEDEERVRNYSVEALRELGYSVIHAHGGREALAIITGGQRVDLLFTDVVMPEMNGRELADAARAYLPGLRVVFTSGYTGDIGVGDDARAGAVLAKPFDVATLARRVRTALDAPLPSG